MTTDTRWTDVDKMLQPAPKGRDELHMRAVQDIAQARFEFPTNEQPSLRTFVNIPEKTLAVTDMEGAELVPDIVIVDTPGNILKILAAVVGGGPSVSSSAFSPPRRSAPEQKPLPAPVMITTLTAESSRASSSAADHSRSMVGVNAFRRSGRFSVIVAMPSDFS